MRSWRKVGISDGASGGSGRIEQCKFELELEIEVEGVGKDRDFGVGAKR